MMAMTVVTYVVMVLKEYFRQGCPCLFRSLTGLYCPGCGGTRAVRYLLQGEIGRSLWYHPLVGYMAVVIVLESGAWAVRTWGKRKGRAGTVRFLGHYEAEVYVGIGIGAVNWAVKNLALFWRGAELIS
mgnify:FL=1